MDYQEILRNLKPEHDFFIGIDSDGCVFDTMEIKQKRFFIPNAINFFDLHSVEKTVRETWEFVNLYSVHRGGNRFTSLIKVFDYLRDRQEILDGGVNLPSLILLKKWVSTETKLSNSTLRKYFSLNRDPELEKVLLWSENVNREIEKGMGMIPPFPHAVEALKKLSLKADLVIVSQTPLEALEREWAENGLSAYVRLIAGQEHGTKAEHLLYAAGNKYGKEHVLMIGDAIGDLNAARQNRALFYPVIPGLEDFSWQRFLLEGMTRFFRERYSGKFEVEACREFEISLPSVPFWQK